MSLSSSYSTELSTQHQPKCAPKGNTGNYEPFSVHLYINGTNGLKVLDHIFPNFLLVWLKWTVHLEVSLILPSCTTMFVCNNTVKTLLIEVWPLVHEGNMALPRHSAPSTVMLLNAHSLDNKPLFNDIIRDRNIDAVFFCRVASRTNTTLLHSVARAYPYSKSSQDGIPVL